MGAVWKIFSVGWRQVLRDGMLLMLLPAPFLMGAALRFIIPLLDTILMRELGFTISPWYPLCDGLILTVAPLMTAMASAFILLDERDEGIGIYYNITPSGGRSYLLARVALPMAWAFISSVAVVALFGLAVRTPGVIFAAATVGTFQGVISCMLLATLAGNKVEGLALAKITNMLILGLPVPWFLQLPYQYLFAFLPSFWLGKIIHPANVQIVPNLLAGIVAALVWITGLYNAFVRRTA